MADDDHGGVEPEVRHTCPVCKHEGKVVYDNDSENPNNANYFRKGRVYHHLTRSSSSWTSVYVCPKCGVVSGKVKS